MHFGFLFCEPRMTKQLLCKQEKLQSVAHINSNSGDGVSLWHFNPITGHQTSALIDIYTSWKSLFIFA